MLALLLFKFFFLIFMYSIGIAASILGVCVKTLRRWDAQNKIRCIRTIGGHRRFSSHEIERIVNGKNETLTSISQKEIVKKCVIYARVSSHKQSKRGDLNRQIARLKEHAKKYNLIVSKIYKDIGSGLNTNRKGLWNLIRDAKNGNFSIILLSFKDRLTRFGYSYLKRYLLEFNVTLRPISKLDNKTPESELVEDLVAIIHSFSGKLYRMRRTQNEANEV